MTMELMPPTGKQARRRGSQWSVTESQGIINEKLLRDVFSKSKDDCWVVKDDHGQQSLYRYNNVAKRQLNQKTKEGGASSAIISEDILVDREYIDWTTRTSSIDLSFYYIQQVNTALQSSFHSNHNLTTLKLDNNYITTISNLELLVNLTCLDLSFNRIKTIGTGLRTLTKLSTLSLSHNLIEKIEGLENCTQLSCLSLTNNRIGPSSLSSQSTVSQPPVVQISVHTTPDNGPICDATNSAFEVERDGGKQQDDGDEDGYSLYGYMTQFSNLQAISIKGNPLCCVDSHYRVQLFQSCPSLQYVDYDKVEDSERQIIFPKNKVGAYLSQDDNDQLNKCDEIMLLQPIFGNSVDRSRIAGQGLITCWVALSGAFQKIGKSLKGSIPDVVAFDAANRSLKVHLASLVEEVAKEKRNAESLILNFESKMNAYQLKATKESKNLISDFHANIRKNCTSTNTTGNEKCFTKLQEDSWDELMSMENSVAKVFQDEEMHLRFLMSQNEASFRARILPILSALREDHNMIIASVFSQVPATNLLDGTSLAKIAHQEHTSHFDSSHFSTQFEDLLRRFECYVTQIVDTKLAACQEVEYQRNRARILEIIDIMEPAADTAATNTSCAAQDTPQIDSPSSTSRE